MSEPARSTKFAVILFPDDETDRWMSNVICSEGPTRFNAALPYLDAYKHANEQLQKMLEDVPWHNMQFWTIHTTHDAGRKLALMDLQDLFAVIEHFPLAPLTGVQHTIVNF